MIIDCRGHYTTALKRTPDMEGRFLVRTFWVGPKEKIVAMIQRANQEIRPDFEMAVMQAIVE